MVAANEKYMLCIDNGLSVGKAALVDYKGSIAGISSFKNELINDGCFSEIDMNSLYKKTAGVIKDLIRGTDISPDRIIAVGNSGHGGGIYPVDRTGIPLRNAITSMDARGEQIIAGFKKNGLDSYPITYANMWNGQAMPLLNWLKKNEREKYSRIHKILFCKDWIKFKLTGKYNTDYTDASNAGLINLNTKKYDRDLYKLYDLPEIYEKLPELSKSEEIIGYVTKTASADTGLNEGTPVIGGMVDFIACLIGSGLYDESAYSIVSGTWGINSAIKADLTICPEIMAMLIFPCDRKFLATDTSPNSAANLEWFLSELLEKTGFVNVEREHIYKRIDEEIKKIDISKSSIFYFPFIYRSKLSKKMEGALYGFNSSNNFYDLIFSIYEGVVFSHLMHINNLKKSGINCSRAFLSGGASNSESWCQMFADILNMEIKTTLARENGLHGLAIYQMLGIGLYKNLRDSIGNIVKTKSTYKPDSKKNSIYVKRFEEFEKIKQLLDR